MTSRHEPNGHDSDNAIGKFAGDAGSSYRSYYEGEWGKESRLGKPKARPWVYVVIALGLAGLIGGIIYAVASGNVALGVFIAGGSGFLLVLLLFVQMVAEARSNRR